MKKGAKRLAEAYVTKYVVSTGVIRVVDVAVDEDGYLTWADGPSRNGVRLFHGPSDYALTQEGALTQARKKVKAAQASLERRKKKLAELASGLELGVLPLDEAATKRLAPA